jgi:hypothetical protein
MNGRRADSVALKKVCRQQITMDTSQAVVSMLNRKASDPDVDPSVQEQTVHRLFYGIRECTKEEHAMQWLRDWKNQNPSRRKLPSAQRIRTGVMARYALSISRPVALAAISRLRIEPGLPKAAQCRPQSIDTQVPSEM